MLTPRRSWAAQKAADADTPDDMAEDQVALQIEQSYSFKRIRSWNNEELFVELEIVTKGPFAPSLPLYIKDIESSSRRCFVELRASES